VNVQAISFHEREQTMTNTKGRVWIGTSNVVIPGSKKDFPLEFQAGSRLAYYGSLFRSVELNCTFYKLPLSRTLEKWATEVPADFRFTVKLWKGITHQKKLVFDVQDIDRFMHTVDHLGSKKGCLLVQFPGSITSDYSDHVQEILERIHQQNKDGNWQVAVELRNASWYHELTYELLNKYRASLVFHDKGSSRTPKSNEAISCVYLRYHGPRGDYKESYPDSFLQEQAEAIHQWTQSGKEVYVYFNNTIGNAFQNAQLLQKLCGGF